MTVSAREILEAMVLAARETHSLTRGRGDDVDVDVDALADAVYYAASNMNLDVTYTEVLSVVQNS